MSTHSCPVVEIKEIFPHPNADKLEKVIINGWQCCVQKGNWKVGDKAVYIEPDMMVPTSHPSFEFLKKDGQEFARIKAKRLRGEMSYGLLVPVPTDGFTHAGWSLGDDLMTALGVQRYEPPEENQSTFANELPLKEWPDVRNFSKFDVESFNNYNNIFYPGEEVVITEKIHGANARYVWSGGKVCVGSRTRWLKMDGNMWHKAVGVELTALLAANPDVVFYGELYGYVQSLHYGLKKGEVKFACFAARDGKTGRWLDHQELYEICLHHDVPTVPVLYKGPFNPDIFEIAERDSIVSKDTQLMEGIVIKPIKERNHPSIGRVILKHISNRYWESKH